MHCEPNVPGAPVALLGDGKVAIHFDKAVRQAVGGVEEEGEETRRAEQYAHALERVRHGSSGVGTFDAVLANRGLASECEWALSGSGDVGWSRVVDKTLDGMYSTLEVFC